jgi:putative PEP-CTERM system TPR-repeat lipoprotein
MYELALAEQAAGRNAEAIRWLEKTLAQQRTNVAAAARLVELHLAAKAPEAALDVAKGISAALPENLDALAALATVYLALGDAKQAQTILDRMSRLAAFNPAWQTRIARSQLQANDAKGASYSLDKALSAAPDYLPAQALLAEMDLRAGALDKAEERAKALVKRAPEQATGYLLLAEVAMARRNYPEALNRFRAALAREQSTDVAMRLFAAHVRSGSAAAGNQFLESWVRDHPQDRRAKHALAEGYLRAGNLPAARARYEQLLKEQGEDESVLNNLAYILLAQGEAKALEYAERAHRLAPSDPAIGDTLGWVLVQQGQVEQGIRHLRDARLRDPASPEIRYHLAEALARAGRNDEARRELEPAVKAGVDFGSRKSALALWRNLGGQP